MAVAVLEDVHVEGVLRGVSLALEGGVLGLFGRNGSGKTSVLRVLFGSLKPSRGLVRRPSRVGASWQNPYLSFYRPTIMDELEAAVGSRERARGVLEELGLGDRGGDSPFKLSVGQARLLSVRLASLWGPELVLVDEPTTGLDRVEKRRVGEFLRGLGIPVVMASHDPLFVTEYADRVAYMEGGRVLWVGEPRPLLERLEGWGAWP